MNKFVNMSVFVFDYLNNKKNNLKKIFQFILSTNLSDTIKFAGFLAKNAFIISVDVTEIYCQRFSIVKNNN